MEKNTALVVIDIQNDITKHYKEIIDNINLAIDWASERNFHIIYIRHNNVAQGTRLSSRVPKERIWSLN